MCLAIAARNKDYPPRQVPPAYLKDRHDNGTREWMTNPSVSQSNIARPTRETVSAQLSEFLAAELGVADVTSIDANQNLIREGLVDSVGVLQIVAFIEKNY